ALCMAFSVLIGLALLVALGNMNTLDTTYTAVAMLLSSTVMGLALLERMRNHNLKQQQIKTELATNYAITPIGMFTLDSQQRFIRMNPVLRNMLDVSSTVLPHAKWTDFFEEVDWQTLGTRTAASEDTEIRSRRCDREGNRRHFAIRAVVMDNII